MLWQEDIKLKQCQKQTRGFKTADYKSFDTKKEEEEWLKTQPRDKENHDEANEHNEKELQYPEQHIIKQNVNMKETRRKQYDD